ncbi:MAG: DUF2069 domain-containing protein [Rubrivivax sp.]|jgi:uncharacterized membrane protein|nr:DUF2069 domain-containing protein [Rubrivivax sp.]
MTSELQQASEPSNAVPPAVQRARLSAVLALVGTLALWLIRELWLAPTGSGSLIVLALPLLLCAAGLIGHRMVTFRWLSLLLWIYFGLAVIRATTESGIARGLAVVELALLLWLFTACVVYIRQRQGNARPAAGEVAPTKV